MKNSTNPKCLNERLPAAHRNQRVRWLSLFAWLALPMLALAAQDSVPSSINYQGKLTDSQGLPVASGDYDIAFRIWDNPTTSGQGSYIWGRKLPVHVVSNGTFNVLLNDGGGTYNTPTIPLFTNILQSFEQPNRYLSLTITRLPEPLGNIATPSEILPRQQLVTAPYAIHAYHSTYARTATNATLASLATNATLASYAGYATNAGKFATFTTNDFLMVNRASQTLNGSLTVTNGNLTLSSNLTVKGSISGNLTVTNGNLTLSSNLTVSGSTTLNTLKANGNVGIGITTPTNKLHVTGGATFDGPVQLTSNVRFGNNAPIEIKQFSPTNMPNSSSGVVLTNLTDTLYPTNTWSAAIVGFKFEADVSDAKKGTPFLEFMMKRGSPNWIISFAFLTDQDISGIKVDVMFIRKELVQDVRP